MKNCYVYADGSPIETIHSVIGNDLIGTYNIVSGVKTHNYFLKDHPSLRQNNGGQVRSGQVLGSIKVRVNEQGETSYDDYDPFGYTMDMRSSATGEERFKFTGKERDVETSYDYFGARYYDSRIGRWLQVDPLAEKYAGWSPYNYVMNNPMKYIDPNGTDTLYFSDSNTRPKDNYKSTTYTGLVYVYRNGEVIGVYESSTYANSKSAENNDPAANQVNEGWLSFNNRSGHKLGTVKGLNIIDDQGNRANIPGTSPSGNDIMMSGVNVHSGASNNGGTQSRGSLGCLTINPKEVSTFFEHFDWSGKNGTTGSSFGSVYISRGNGVPIPIGNVYPKPLQDINLLRR